MAQTVPVITEDPRLAKILDQIIGLAKGDFETRAILSDKGDELDAIMAGLNLLGEELTDKTRFIEENRKRLNSIIEVLIKATQMDFSGKMEITEKGDELDAIALGLNTMSEELESNIRQLNDSQEKIKHTLFQLNEAQHLTHIGSWEWDIATNSINWSDELFRIYGRERGDFETTFKNYLNFIHPADRDNVNETIQRTLQNKKPCSFLHRIIRPNGSEAILDCKGEVYTNDAGELVRMTGTAQDITELKKAEEKIAKLAGIVDSSGDAIISKTLNGIITSWNKEAEKLFGYATEEILGKHISILFPSTRASDEEQILNQIRQGKAIINYETEHKKKDGTVFSISATISPIYDSYGKITGISKIARDITEKKLAEAKLVEYTRALEQKHKETEEFAYVASHDLQEPLRTITNYIGLFNEEYKGKLDKEADMYLEFITSASTRMKVLINDLLEYTRIENDKNILEIDMNILLNDILSDLGASITESRAVIHSTPLPVIKGYYSRMKSLFQNLISNAIKFKKPGEDPVINITSEDKGSEWLFSIKDNGIGIDMTYDEKIFKLFQRLHSRAEYEGTGIGLAHCKKIVELRGGKIWVESELGEGSTFYFTLPKNVTL